MSKQYTQAADERRVGLAPGPTQDSHSKDERDPSEAAESPARDARPKEYGGRKGPDPVRYGDWEKNGRCIDF